MPYYLVPYIGTGAGDDPRRLDIVGDWESLPLGDTGTAVAVTDGIAPSTAIALGDTLDSALSGKTKRDLKTRLGFNISAGTVRDLFPELVLTHLALPVELVRRDGQWWRQIKLRGLVWEQLIPGGPGAMFTESFNQPDSTVLGPDQTWEERGGDFSTAGGELAPPNTAATAYIVGEPATGDQYATGHITADASGRLNFVVRGHSTDDTFYGAELLRSLLGRNWRLIKYIAGAATVLGSVGTGGAVVPCDLRIEAQSSSISLLVNGVVTLGPVTDTDIAASNTAQRRVGVYVPSTALNYRVDSFEAGDYTNTATATLVGASETDTATALAVTSSTAVLGSTSSEAAGGLTSRVEAAIGGATEGSTAGGLTSRVETVIGGAAEGNAAGGLTASTLSGAVADLVGAPETDAVGGLSVAVTSTPLAGAEEADASGGLTARTVAEIESAFEGSAAGELRWTLGVELAGASEADAAGALVLSGGSLVLPDRAVWVDPAGGLSSGPSEGPITGAEGVAKVGPSEGAVVKPERL